jgi:uncharacterized protein (DUF885 family)
MSAHRRVASLALPALLSCATPQQPPPAKLAAPAQVAVRHSEPSAAERLRGLSDAYWTALLQTGQLPLLGEGGLGGPLAATAMGDHRFDGRLDDLSPEAHTRTLQEIDRLRTEVDSIPAGQLGGEDALTLEILRGQLEDIKSSLVCNGEDWLVDQMNGVQVALAQTAQSVPLGTAQGAAELAARYGQAARLFDQQIANLSRGLAAGRTSPKTNVQKVIAQLAKLNAGDFLPAEEKFKGLPAAQREPAREAIAKAINDSVLPGLQRYRDFLQTKVLPKARTDVGLWALPGGEACYAFLIRYHTGSQQKPKELHELGLKLLSGIEEEQREIARAQGLPVDLKALRRAIDSRKDQFKQTAEELLDWNKATLARAMAALPQAFHRLPPRPIVTRAIEAYRSESNTPAFYQPASDDGAQPGIYYVNLWKPGTRALYNEEALCFHEAVPGHHLQISIAQELKGLPDFRRQTGETAYIEGWALYAERLADETLHLYSGPLARYGMLGYQAWRASRLVVDTGMHALHWDRQKALDFLREHTTLPEKEAENEIDRYVIMPGQALAYMVGEQEIFRLRHDAERRLGARFDLKEFHDVVLDHGAVPLSVLGRTVDEWVQRKAAPGR